MSRRLGAVLSIAVLVLGLAFALPAPHDHAGHEHESSAVTIASAEATALLGCRHINYAKQGTRDRFLGHSSAWEGPNYVHRHHVGHDHSVNGFWVEQFTTRTVCPN